MGKKIFLGVLQVLSFLIIYEVIIRVLYCLFIFVLSVLQPVPIIGKYITNTRAGETIVYTITPLLSGIVIVNIMRIIWKKIGVYIVSAVLMFMVVSYAVISALIYNINMYGIISWNVANIIWYDIILCAIIFLGIFSMVTTKSKISNITDDIEIK